MVRKTASTRPPVRPYLPVFVAAVILTGFGNVKAESVASKNREGNRLFAKGRYEDAEKAYLDAQVKSPGRPEVLYNLGNSLIKQRKYDPGIQALRQSMSKGDKGIKENSWYNAGNALFSMGSFKDAAEAYIQALRLDPADRDAKHNLELALMNQKQQEQKQSQNQKQQNSGNRNQDRSQAGKEDQKQSNKKDQNSGKPKEPNEPERAQTPKIVPREGTMSKEQALQMLDAVQNRELEEQRKLLERRARENVNEKDW